MGLAANQKLQLGAEATKGTAVAATTIWRGTGALEDAREVLHVPEQIGIAVPTNRILTPAVFGRCNMAASPATFQQLPYLGMAGIKSITGVQDGTGTDYIYDFVMGNTTVNTVKTYTIEGGDDVAAEELDYGVLESMTISGKAREPMQMSANWFGRQVSSSTFTGSLSVPTIEEVLTIKGTLSIDDNDSSFGTTPVAAGNILEFDMSFTTGRKPVYTIDTGQLYFYEDLYDRDAVELVINITWRHKTAAGTEKANWQNEVPRLLELKFEGSQFATPGTVYTYHTLLIQAAGVWDKFDPLDKAEGDSIIKASFKGGYDETAAEFFHMIVVNELDALP